MNLSRTSLRPLIGVPVLALAGLLLACPALGADRAVLRGDVVANQDVVRLSDLVENAPAALAETALFRAPALGQSGTIQTARIVEAAASLGVPALDTGGQLQITVTRAARLVGAGEIETALRQALAEKHGFDPVSTGITFDGAAPALTLAAGTKGDVFATDLLLDRRNRRLSATIAVGISPGDRRASLRVTGTAVDLVEVAVVSRPLERGATVKASDITLERRPRDVVPVDAALDGAPLPGRVARRALGSGTMVRTGDLARPELVGRGDLVTVVYDAPGMSLSMRAKASEAGALGDVIPVVNPGSKKILQATVVAPGRVSVRAGQTERVVAAVANTPSSRP